MSEFISPVLSYSLLSPILVVFAGAIIGVLIEAGAGWREQHGLAAGAARRQPEVSS